MLLRQLKFNLGFINPNVYPLAVSKSKPDLRLSKRRFKFRGSVTPGDGSGAASDKPNRADDNLQSRDRLSIRTSNNANLQPSSEKNVISYFAHEVYVLPICALNGNCSATPGQETRTAPQNHDRSPALGAAAIWRLTMSFVPC